MHLLETFLRQFVGLSATKFQKVKAFLHDTFENNHYRCLFVAYTAVVSLVSSCLMYGIQQASTDDEDGTASVTFFETWFTAISCFSCTGLTIARVTQWRGGAQVVMMMTIEFGSLVLCSSIPSILRLRRLWGIRCPSADRPLVRRHVNVNLAIVWCCVAYWFLVQLVAFLLLVGKRGAWWSIFHVASGFNNAGFSLDPNSFANPDVANDAYVIVVFCILMPMGNTLFPVWQQLVARGWKRLMFAVAWWWPSETYTPRMVFFGLTAKEMAEAIDELLSRPYLYYTHIFSRRQTFVLLMMWLGLTTADYLMFIPEYNTNAFISTKHQWLQALFQTITVRTCGFTIMDLSKVDVGHISYWILSMYLSSYPFMIADGDARSTADDDDDDDCGFPDPVEPPNSGGAIRSVGSLALAVPSSAAEAASSVQEMEASGEQQAMGNASFASSGHRTALTAHSLTVHSFAHEPSVIAASEPFEDVPLATTSRRFDPAVSPQSNDSYMAPSNGAFVPQGVRQALATIKSQASNTVAQEVGWLYLCCIAIAYAEGQDITSAGRDSSPMLRTIFEVSSAYGTVGLSMASAADPTLSYSFALHAFSQVLIVLLMYFGKFRGLPQTIKLDDVQHLLHLRETSRSLRYGNHSSATRAEDAASTPSATLLHPNNGAALCGAAQEDEEPLTILVESTAGDSHHGHGEGTLRTMGTATNNGTVVSSLAIPAAASSPHSTSFRPSVSFFLET